MDCCSGYLPCLLQAPTSPPRPSSLELKSCSTFPLLKRRRSIPLLLGQSHDPCTQRARPPHQLHLPHDGPSSSSMDWLCALTVQGTLSLTPWHLTALLLLVSAQLWLLQESPSRPGQARPDLTVTQHWSPRRFPFTYPYGLCAPWAPDIYDRRQFY